jgi:hypothetical protein
MILHRQLLPPAVVLPVPLLLCEEDEDDDDDDDELLELEPLLPLLLIHNVCKLNLPSSYFDFVVFVLSKADFVSSVFLLLLMRDVFRRQTSMSTTSRTDTAPISDPTRVCFNSFDDEKKSRPDDDDKLLLSFCVSVTSGMGVLTVVCMSRFGCG